MLSGRCYHTIEAMNLLMMQWRGNMKLSLERKSILRLTLLGYAGINLSQREMKLKILTNEKDKDSYHLSMVGEMGGD